VVTTNSNTVVAVALDRVATTRPTTAIEPMTSPFPCGIAVVAVIVVVVTIVVVVQHTGV